MARDGYTREGRLFLSSGAWWNTDFLPGPGYPGFDTTPTASAANKATLVDMMTWLTGKTSGANVLICEANPTPPGYPYGAIWQAALLSLGHTFTLSGALHFNGLNPLDYDCVHVDYVAAPGNAFGIAVDAYLDAKGAVLSVCDIYRNTWGRYGVVPRTSAPFYQTYPAAPNYLTTYPSLPIGGATYQVTQFTNSILLATGGGTRGGTTTVHNNASGEGGMAAWVLA